MRDILKSFWFIHLMVFLCLFALAGFLIKNQKVLIFLSVLSFLGALCGAFIRLIDLHK